MKLVSLYSTIKMKHSPINIRTEVVFMSRRENANQYNNER